MEDLIIVGASGFGREVAWLIERINSLKPTWNLIGFVDDNDSIRGTEVGNYIVLGGCEIIKNYPNAYYVCAIGVSKIRRTVINNLKDIFPEIKFATVIDPSVLISDRVSIGEGSIICAGTIITVDIKIGNHVIINLDCTVGHDDIIEDYVTIYPCVSISGNVVLRECSELGTGMQIIQDKIVAAGTIIGAGAVVVKNIDEVGTYVGSPAKKIK